MNFVNAPVIGHINKEAFERFVCSDIEAIDMDNVVFCKPLFTHILNTGAPTRSGTNRFRSFGNRDGKEQR